jgi:hypothetical protein
MMMNDLGGTQEKGKEGGGEGGREGRWRKRREGGREGGRGRTKTYLVLIDGLVDLGIAGHGHAAHELPILLAGLFFLNVDSILRDAFRSEGVVSRRVFLPF